MHLWTAAWVATLLAGCGASCPAIQAERSAWTERAVKRSAEPHLVFDVPVPLVEKHLRPAVTSAASVDLSLSGLGRFSDLLGNVTVKPAAVAVVDAPAGALGLRIVFEARKGRSRLFTVETETRLRPEVDLKHRKVVLRIDSKDVRRVRPKLGAGSVRSLASYLRNLLPSAARRFVSLGSVERIATAALNTLLDEGFTSLRDGPMASLGTLAKLSFDLPAIPLADVKFTTLPDALRFELHSSLPVAEGVSRRPHTPTPGRIHGRISGAAFAELLNHGVSKGWVPGRFNSSGKSDAAGDYEARYAWAQGERRPMRGHLWRTTGVCMSAQVEAIAKAKPHRDKKGRPTVQFSLHEGEMTQMNGPVLLQIAAFFQSLGADAVEIAQQISGATRFRIGNTPIRLVIVGIGFEADDLAFELQVGDG